MQGSAALAETPGAGRECIGLDSGEVRKLPIPFRDDFVGRTLARTPLRQWAEQHGRVDIRARAPAAGASENGEHVALLAVGQHDSLCFLYVFEGVIETGSVGSRQHDHRKGAILARHVFDRDGSDQGKTSSEQCKRKKDEQDGVPSDTAQHRFIPVGKATKPPINEMREAATVQAVVVKQLRRQHRHERQRDQAREGNSRRKGNTELAEDGPDIAGHERYRQDDRNEDECRRDDGKADFTAAVGGGEQRWFAALDAPRDIFEDDDCVVDDESNGQHESEQG